MSKKLVTEFLDEAITTKKKQLLGITIDISYYEDMTKGKDVEALRKELAGHQRNLIRGEKGKILKDNRDMDEVNRIVEEIDMIEKGENELQRLRIMEKQIRKYLAFLLKPTPEATKKMEEIVK